MRKRKILIIDDEKEMAHVERLRLEAHGYDVLVAYDGEKGFEIAKMESPDLIILDIMLPKADGYEVCRRFKQDIGCKNIPIILVSAVDQKYDTNLGKKIGADDFFTKPFDPPSLLAKIKELTKNQPK